MKVVKWFDKQSYLFATLILALPLVCFAQTDNTDSHKHGQRPNGISAGRPKVFDNRTLTLMLEALSDQLRNVQVIDQKTLSAALGLQQGFSSTDFTSSFTATTLPIPGSKQETVTKTGNVGSTGNPLPDTTQKTTTTSRDAVVPQIPALEAPAGPPAGFNPSYGESSGDLLSDQVNLSYQIFNLRMLLERSLSDRLLESRKPRLQAVIGMNITLDPPRTANDAVAVVEVTIEASDHPQPDGLSLISLMPQEKTYNSAAVSTKSNSFGGSAVVKMVQVGYNQRKKSMVFYLYRDTDTLAYERTPPTEPNDPNKANKVTFGWMFRPVLGRRSVSPGLRQMFAILALPAEDGDAAHKLKATVKTYWKKYDRSTATSFRDYDANRAKNFEYSLSLGLNRPQIFGHRYENGVEYPDIEVQPTAAYEESLRAVVDDVYWRPVGAKTALVSVKGKNFFTDTKVSVGDKIYASPADGFLLKSTQSFDLTTPLDALASGPGAVLSRYGRAVPLISTVPAGLPANGMTIQKLDIHPSLAGYRVFDIFLMADSNDGKKLAPLIMDQLPRDLVSNSRETTSLPIITVNNNVVPLPYTMIPVKNAVLLQANVPDSYLADGGGILKVSWPFLPADKWTKSWRIADPKLEYEVIRLTSNTIIIYSKSRLGFTKVPENGEVAKEHYCWQLLAGDNLTKLYTSACKEGTPGPIGASDNPVSMKQAADIPDKIILISPYEGIYQLDVPKAKADDSSTVKPIVLKQYDALWVEIPGKDLTGAAYAEANKVTLKVRPLKSAKAAPAKATDTKSPPPITKIEVEITREVTAKPGDVDLTILDKDGKPVGSAHLQITCVLCGEGGK
jgi:hypothetical protein